MNAIKDLLSSSSFSPQAWITASVSRDGPALPRSDIGPTDYRKDDQQKWVSHESDRTRYFERQREKEKSEPQGQIV